MQMSLSGDRFDKTVGVAQLTRDGRERLNAIPGVEASASTCCLPLEGGFGLPFDVVGRPAGKDPHTGGAGWMNTSPGYFDVFRIPILRGRDFTVNDALALLQASSSSTMRWPKNSGPRKIPSVSRLVIGKGRWTAV